MFGATSTVDIKTLIDVDQSQATGCTVVTTNGIFKGIDSVVTTHVSVTDGTTGRVTSVTRQTCTDPIANTFSGEAPIDTTGWPIVITPSGTMHIESYAPVSLFGTINHMRLAFTVTSGTLTDSVVQQRDGDSILWPPVLPPHGHASSHAAPTRIFTLDGDLSDWSNITWIATGIGPSSPSLRFLNVYTYQTATNLYFAFAVQSNANAPTANDDTYSVVSGGSLGIAVPGVLTNDTDPNHKPLTAVLVAGPQHGTLALNSDGSFDYTNDGSPATRDNFEYKASNGTADSNTAQAAITITTEEPPPPNEQAPQFTSPSFATFRAGQAGAFLVTTTGHPTPAVTMTGTLPSGLIFIAVPGGGSIIGTPAVGTGGLYHLTFHATNVHGTATQNFQLTVQEAPAILSANSTTFTAGQSSTFAITTRGYPYPTITESGALPPGVTLTDNHNGTATLGGIPTAGGVYPIVINASNGIGSPASQNFTLTVNQAPAFTSVAATNFTAGSPGTFTVTTVGYPNVTVALTGGTLPTGVTFTPNGNGTGTLSGTPAVGTGGVYNLQFTASNGIGSNAVQNFALTVLEAPSFTSAANTTFTTSTPGTFTVTVLGYPIPTINETGALPSGVTFTDNGNRTATLAGTPAANSGGSYPLTLTATNTVATVNQNFALTVNQPPLITSANALSVQAGTPVNFTVTTTGYPAPAIGESGALPNGLTYTDNGNGTGTISGTPAAGSGGVYPITFTATNVAGTDNQNFTITACNTIVVTNPATNTGTANAAFSQTFTQTGAVGSATFSTTSTLPAGLSLSTGGVLSGTPTVIGSFPIVVTVTDANGCTGSGATYTLTISCQTITVTNPATNTGTVNAAFSQSFTSSNTIGTVTYSTGSTIPTGLTFNANGTLSGTPTQTGTFPITVTATDANGCQGTGATYTLTINCQVIPVTNPANSTGTAGSAFSEDFTAGNTVGAVTFTTASTLPTGLSLATNGTLSGTPTQTGTFPIVVTATDANGCSGSGSTYNLVINCQTITVTNPANSTGTAGAAFSEQFTQSAAIGGATFSTASTLPAGLTLSSAGLLSGTPTQTGTFPITVTVTDGNGCTGTGATYNLIINCPVITVTNPATSSGVAGTAFSQTFTQSGAVGGATFSTASTLPAGLTLSGAGLLSGTPTQTGTFPIVVTVTDGNGCTGTGATYNLVINCQTITVTNPATNTGVAGSPFSQTFTQSGAIGGATFSSSSTLPVGLSLSTGGVLSGTPTQTGSFPIVVTVTDGNGCTGTGATYTLTITCQTITVTNPATNTGVAGAPFSQTFTQSGAIGGATFTTGSALPTGLTLSSGGVLSGTPTVIGTFPIVVTVTDGNGCTGTGATYNLTISCQTITVTNPATTTGTAAAAFSQTFTASNTIGTVTFSESGALPTGLTFHTGTGVLDGTPTVTGTFPITVTATDANGCQGTGATYNLVINCQTITVTNPANNTGTVSAAFSEQFTQSGSIGTATFSTASTLPTGLTLSSSGLLSGTPLQPGSFPIVVTVTDSNGCTGSGATYTLTINCQTITVTNPSSNSDAAGTPLVAANFTFTQSGAIGGATFTTASTLPTGVSLTTGGVLTGTPTQGGSFPITVTVTDGNGCTGVSSGYTLTITCPVITVTNPGVSSGTAGVAFSQTFTQSGGQGTITWSEIGTLPTGIILNTSTGVLSGTTHEVGTFPITVTATDQNGCQGSGSTYNLTIGCQTVTVTNPGVNTGTVDAAFSQTFTVSGILDTVTWSESGALPAGITLDPSTGVLSGTPTVNGSFPITVKATDANGCFGTSPYTLTINCQTITVTNPVTNSGTVDAAFSQTFTQSGAHGTATFSTASTLPAGLSLSAGGVLSGTPTVKGSFPIVVTVTDSNGCTGTGATYTLTINCQTITVTNPATSSGTVSAPFSQTFTQSGAHATATFTTASTLPTGLSLSTAGVLSGTPTQPGSFPIVVTVTDANGCTGSGSTYTLVIACQTITVTNPANANGTVASPFSEQFTQSSGLGTLTWSETGALPTGITLNSSTGVLSGTPTQSGSFPITVKATDGNGCFGTSPYTLVIACNVITVTDPATNSGTAGQPFSATFTQSGGNGTITWSTSSTLPTGITLNSSTGVLSGTPTQVGAYPLVITATDGNGCSGNDSASNYTLTINCNTVTITNATSNTVQASTTLTPASNWTFTASGNVGTITWTETGSLPTGITLSTAGVLSGSSTQIGSFPITVKATDSDGCFSTSPYTLTVTCPTITPARNGGGSFPAGTVGSAYTGQSFVATGGSGTYTFAKTAGNLPTGLSLSSAGAISGTPTATGTFTFTVTATDSSTSCTGSASFSIAINPSAGTDAYSNLVNNTQAVVTGGSTTSPTTPFVGLTGTVIANDLPAGGVAVQPGTASTAQGGSVTVAADGTFIYTPPVTASALASDSFTYTIQSDTGATGTPTTATGTVNLTLSGRVWYIQNNVTNGNGQSQSPFNSTSNFSNGARSSPDAAGDIIYIYNGDGTTTNLTSGVKLLANEQLIGQGVALVVNTNTLVAAGTKPQITNTAATSDAVTLNDGNTVKGLTITAATRDGIAGSTHAGFIADTLIIQNNTASGLHLTSMTGTVTVTNTAIVNNATGLDVNNGTAAINLDNTNNINSGATQRTVSIQNRPASAGTIAIGATINDSGTGILVNNNASGTINFTGTQTANVGGTNIGVNLTSNTGTTINFSGTLSDTSATGTAFNATGGGTLTVTGTANVSTGAAATGVNINGVTVGASKVTFNSVNTTGATTGVSLTSLGNGSVTINGGTINATTTSLSLSTLGTSTVTLAGVTISGATTGISGSTFGTLSIGSSVSVSGVTALNLNTGAVSGTFASVSSTGGTNGVTLTSVTGTWGTTGGTLTGATGATFNVSGGGSGTISWAATINQANGANAVTIAGSNANTINFSGSVTTSGTSTGINISASTGTYNFTGGASTIVGTGGGITIFNEASGTISFGSGYSINGATTPFKIGGSATNVGASITYSGTITDNVNGGVLLDVNSASGTFNGTLTMNGTSLSGTVAGLNGVKAIINNMTGTLSVSNLSLTSSNNNFTGNLLTIGGTNTAGSFTFPNLTLNTSGGSAHAGLGVVASGGGTLTISGTSSINTSSTALSVNGMAFGTSTLGTLTSSGGVNGVVLTSVTGNLLTATGGSLSGSSSTEFLVNGGAPNFSYGGNITSTNQYLIDVGSTSGITGGALTFSGTLGGASTSAGLGIRVQNSSNSPAFTFSGTQTLGTTGSRMSTGGAAVTLTNNGSASFTFSGTLSIATSGTMEGLKDTNASTGTSLNITGVTGGVGNSTIDTADSATVCPANTNCSAALDLSRAALNVTLGTVNVAGTNSHVPVGFMLSNTTGSFSITGDNSNRANHSGGTITVPTTGTMTISNGSNTVGCGLAYFQDVAGTVSIKSIDFSMNNGASDGTYQGVLFDNNADSNTLNATVTGCFFNANLKSTTGAQGKASLQWESGGTSGTPTITGSVQNCYFQGGRSYGVFASPSAGTMNITVNQSAFGTSVNTATSGTNKPQGGTNTVVNAPPFALAVAQGASGSLTYSITNNTIVGSDGNFGAIYALTIAGGFDNTSANTCTGTISGNQIGFSGVTGSGCANNCAGIGLEPNSLGTFNATVTNNTIQQTNSVGIKAINSLSTQTGVEIFHINNNAFGAADTTGGPLLQRAIWILAGKSGGVNSQVCLDMNGNTFSVAFGSPGAWGSGSTVAVRLDDQNNNSPGYFKMPGYAGGATDTTAAATFAQGNNPSVATNGYTVSAAYSGTNAGFIGGSACP